MRSVQYPGREDRIQEPLLDSCSKMVKALADAWPQITGAGHYAIFGHSMGALLAFEVVRELVARGASHLPSRLFLSGRNPPHCCSTILSRIDRSDESFLLKLHEEGAIHLPPPILHDKDMVRLLTPILRADCTISDGAETLPSAPLNFPFTVFGGTEDPWTTLESLAGWERYTTGRCRVKMVPGNHLFHQNSSRDVINAILLDLTFKEPSQSDARTAPAVGSSPGSNEVRA